MIPTAADLFEPGHCPCPDALAGLQFPWSVIPEIESLVRFVVESRPGFYSEYAPGVYIGPGTTIAPSAWVSAPAVLGADCEIRHGAFIRGSVIAGDGCVIGNSTELKNCLLFDGVQVPHFNYVGDSVLGWKAHLGAGVILSNVRLDGGTVKVKHASPDGTGIEHTDTGLSKFGALVGDRTEIGCNSVLNPGTILGRRVLVFPLAAVDGVIPAGTAVRREQK